MIIFCDLDGTLCDDRHRRKWALEKDWDKYHGACSRDKPYEDVLGTLQHWAQEDHTVILMTGRTERHRERTINWLRKHSVPYEVLLMRPDDDPRPTVVVKLAWLKQEEWEDDILVLENDPVQGFVIAEHHGFTVWHIRRGKVNHE